MMRSQAIRCSAAGCAALVLACGQAAAYPTLSFRTVALTGTDGVYGPNMGAGVNFFVVDGAALNLSGQVAFRGNHVSASGQTGVWLRPDATDTSSNQNLALEGTAQPGGGAYAGPNSYNSIGLNNGGMVAFRLGASKAVFASDGTTMKRVALAGDFAPGTGGATYASSTVASGQPLFNQAGMTGYIGTLTTGTGTPAVSITAPNNNSTAIFIGTGDNANNPNANTAPVVRATDWFASLGGTAADTKVGGSFAQATMSFNGGGRYVVTNTLQGSAVVTGTGAGSNSVALISNRTGSNESIARVGNPGIDETGAALTDVYRSFGAGKIGFNNAGHVAYTATLRTAAGAATTQGIFSDVAGGPNGGTLRRIAISGGALPAVYAMGDNTTPLAEFSSLTYSTSTTAAFSTTLLNANDQMLFSANLSAGGQAFLMRDAAGDLHRVIRTADVAFSPDPLSTGGTGTTTISSVSNLALNAPGQVIFMTNLTGPGVSVGLGNGSALWAEDTDGTLFVVARTGTQFTDGLGNSHTISQILVNLTTGNQDGAPSSLNDNGDIAVALSFTDGQSGIFVTHIPAPGTGVLLALGGLAASRRRRNGRGS